MKVLVCDDDAILLKLLSTFLEKTYNAAVVKATNGQDALKMADSESPDLIILDYMMPKMDGIKALQKIKARPAGQKQPKILLYSAFDLKNQARSEGADGFIQKPGSTDKLKQEIDRIMGIVPAAPAKPARF
ncbi:MAG: response regulator [Bdellovibrionota bacterium]